MLRVVQITQHHGLPGLVGKCLHMAATRQLQHPGRRRGLIQANAIGHRHDRIIQAMEQQLGHAGQLRHGVDRTVSVGHQPRQGHLKRPCYPGRTQGELSYVTITGGHTVQYQRLELRLALRVRCQVMHGECATQALAQHNQRPSLGFRRLVDPVERRINVLVDRRQRRLAFRQTIPAIVQQQHLIALLRQPPTAPRCHARLPPLPCKCSTVPLTGTPDLAGSHQA